MDRESHSHARWLTIRPPSHRLHQTYLAHTSFVASFPASPCPPSYSGLEGLRFESCSNLMGPVVEGTTVPNGARVPGTPYQLDPIRAAFNIGTAIRWLDYNGERGRGIPAGLVVEFLV